MKKETVSKIWRAAFVIALLIVGAEGAVLRERVSFNSDWRFRKGDPPGAEGVLSYARIKEWVLATGNEFTRDPTKRRERPSGNLGEEVAYTRPDFDDRDWQPVELPHDWGIEGPFKQEYPGESGKLPWWGVGWYRKHFTVPRSSDGRRFLLEIDGAMAYALVWLNGRFVGGWPYGYASFALDLTPYIEPGRENVLAIRLDNPPESSRWYPGGGIYRNVWLVETGPVHVAHWGTYVTTPEVSPTSATVNVEVTVANASPAPAAVTIRTRIHQLGADGRPLPATVAVAQPVEISVASGANGSAVAQAKIRAPKLWSIENPNLYVAVTTVIANGRPVDEYETRFGVRTIRFDAQQGFLLNGKRVKIQGVCNHHDLGPLGTALNVRALERQLELLKEMGANAIRTSHNPPAPELLDLCDRMGFLVMDEAFDCWRRGKKENDYHLLFDDWHEKDWRAQLRRDRNHPSIILWSIGNEILEQNSPEGIQIATELVRIAHEEDPTRPVTAACNFTEAGYNGFQKVVDVFGYNYKPMEYGKFRQANPNIPLVASETASTVSSRGEYFFPVSDDKSKGFFNFQVSSYDLYAPPWATTPDTEFAAQDQYPFVAGEFVWTGFDYLGEPTPYGGDSTTMLAFTDAELRARAERELRERGKISVPSRSSYFGIIDLCGFPKDRFYLYQARWRPDLPMVHILPHWNWPERIGQNVPVHVYTSGDEVELFLNGRSLGRRKKGPGQYRLRWDDVVYEPGSLRAVAYKNGRKWAETTVRTTGPAARVSLNPDRVRIRADRKDLAFITVRITDRDGLTVPRTHNLIRFHIDGPGEIVAVANGDATSHMPFKANEMRAFNGLCLVIVRSTGRAGTIRVRAQAEGLAEAATVITATP